MTRRGAASPDALLALADHVAGCRALRLDGLMAVAPQAADPDAAFADVEAAAARLRAAHPAATTLSAGMSGDLEAADPALVRGGACRYRSCSANGR